MPSLLPIPPMKSKDLTTPAISVFHPIYTLLLVEDNPTNLGVLFEILNHAEFRLLVAEDGAAALEQVQYIKPDLILLDVMMPRVDGFEACQRLKADPGTQDIPIIFMSALNDSVDKIKGLSMGGVDYITKPIQAEEVLARVRVHLKLHTLQKQLQAQNQQLQTEIEERQQVERSLQLMMRAVSHDLKNPVTGMLMVLQSLLSSDAASPDADIAPEAPDTSPPDSVAVSRSILERMNESAQRQLNLINSLLDIHSGNHDSAAEFLSSTSSSIPEFPASAPSLVLHRKPLHFQTVVTSVIEDLEPLLNKYQVQIRVQVSETLPQVLGDADQLWRVLENLITNAIKHNPPGTEVAIAAQAQSSFLHCWIKDNGNGIPLNEQPQLFEAYQRGSAHRRSPGIGLGLYLCRQIIAAHGGTIELQSVPDQGTIFEFTLPVA